MNKIIARNTSPDAVSEIAVVYTDIPVVRNGWRYSVVRLNLRGEVVNTLATRRTEELARQEANRVWLQDAGR